MSQLPRWTQVPCDRPCGLVNGRDRAGSTAVGAAWPAGGQTAPRPRPRPPAGGQAAPAPPNPLPTTITSQRDAMELLLDRAAGPGMARVRPVRLDGGAGLGLEAVRRARHVPGDP